MARDRNNDLLTNFATTVVLLAAICCAPGLVATFAIGRALDLRLDRAQLWSFGASISGCLIAASIVASRGWTRGISRYFMLSLVTVAVLLVGAHGFKSELVHALWRAVWP